MRSRTNGYSEKYNHNFSILATPAEGLSGKFTQKDRKSFGVIPGVTDKAYYTNPTMCPSITTAPQSPQGKNRSPHTTISHAEVTYFMWKSTMPPTTRRPYHRLSTSWDKYNIGYCSVNHNRNRCMECGYEDATEGLEMCPECGSANIDRLQRITGYLVGTLPTAGTAENSQSSTTALCTNREQPSNEST